MSDINSDERDITGLALVYISVFAGICWTADAEYQLALALGANRLVAAFLPLALDVYAIASVRRDQKGDLFGSLSLMCAAQECAHLLQAHQISVSVPMVTLVSLLVPISIWRAHALAKPPAKAAGKRTAGSGKSQRAATQAAASAPPAAARTAAATPASSAAARPPAATASSSSAASSKPQMAPSSQPPATPEAKRPTATATAAGNDARDLDEVAAIFRKLRDALGKSPSDQALADKLGVSRSRAQQLRSAAVEAGHEDLAKPLKAAS